jgi:hypothetical protein
MQTADSYAEDVPIVGISFAVPVLIGYPRPSEKV